MLVFPALAQAAPKGAVVQRFKDDPIGVVEMRLPNGLTVLLSENHERAEVFGAVIVRAGGKNDPAEHTGIAHYLEHMLFKGTTEMGTMDYAKERPHLETIERLYEQYAVATTDAERTRLQKEIDAAAQAAAKWAIPGEMDNLIAEQGGTGVNAFTTNDITAYYNLFPPSQMDAWLDLYAHRFEEPVFRLFPSELEAVYEEKNRSLDGFMEPAYEEFMRSFFAGHPYGEQPILGTVEHLKRPSLLAMREFYERYYVANNMALVLSGDFEAATIAPLIAEKFGGWRSGEKAVPLSTAVATFAGRQVVTKRLTPIRAGAMAFHTPGQGHEDYAALQIAQRVLSNDDGAGTLDRLVDDGKLLLAMLIPTEFHDQDGLVLLYAPRIVSQRLRRAEKMVRESINALREGRVEASTIEAARRNLLREIGSQWESNDARALAMADTWARHQSWDAYIDMVLGVKSASAAQVAGAADRWIGDDFLSFRSRVGFHRPGKLDKPEFTPVVPTREARSPYYKATHPLADSTASPRFVDFDGAVTRVPVAKGAELTVAANPHNDIYSLSLRFGIGHHARPELVRLAEYLPKVGTEAHGADGFTKALYEIATTLSMDSTDEAFVVTLEGPEAHLAEALGLLNQLMTDPASDSRRLRSVKREAWATERIYRDEPQEVLEALWEYVLYGEGSATRRQGMRALRKFGPDSLLRAWRDVQQRETAIHYVGKKNAGEVAVLLRRAITWPTEPEPSVLPVERPRQAFEGSQVFFVPKRNTVQAQLYFFVEGDPIPVAEAARRDAYQEYLSGSMGGLLFQEVREYRALAYSVYGGYHKTAVANRPGYSYGYIGCQADKMEEAVTVMKSMLTDLPKKPERMGAMRGALSRGQETAYPEFRDLPQTIAEWGWQGYATDPGRLRAREYPKLSWNDVESFWRDHIQGRPIVLMVVGDPRRINMDALREHGPVTVIREPQLYTP